MAQIFLTTTGTNTWTVPYDWNNSVNTIEVIGGGGSGGASTSAGGIGSGGGGYAKISNLSLTAGASVTYAVGIGGAIVTGGTNGFNSGGDTWFNGANYGAASVGAHGSTGLGGGTGNGTTSYTGGSGGASSGNSGGGGGGAAGLNGAGNNGQTGGGSGGSGDSGSGGSGGSSGGVGGNGTEYTASYGSGGGGGGGSGSAGGGAGGSYGAGGGGGSLNKASGGGYQGLIVITYTSLDTGKRYWVSGTGNWDASTTTKWSISSGGGTGAPVPTSSNDVYFDSNSGSGTVTITATANCQSLTTTGYSGNLTGTFGINIYAGMTLIANVLSSYTGTLSFLSTSAGNTLTFAGNNVGAIVFNGVGGAWTLASSSVGLSNTGTVWNFQNGTITSAGTLTININDTSSSTKTFTGGSQSYYGIKFSGGTGAFVIQGSNSFALMQYTTAPITVNFTAGTTQIITGVGGFQMGGTAGNINILQSTSAGSWWYIQSNSIVSVDYVSLQDSHALYI